MDEPEHDVEIAEVTPQVAVNDAPKVEVTEIPDPPMAEYQIGFWNGIPNFGCPYCLFSTIDGSHAVQVHIDEARLNDSHPLMQKQHTREL